MKMRLGRVEQLPDELDSHEAERLRTLLGSETWCIGDVRLDNSSLHFSGWALAPRRQRAKQGFTVNGQVVADMVWGLPRPDIADLFWFWPGAATSGFSATVPIAKDKLFSRGAARVDYVNARTRRAFSPNHSFYFCDFDSERFAIPDHQRQTKVQGAGDDSTFLVEGFSAREKILLTIERHTKVRRDRLGDVLDWGCGCGRLSRHFLNLPGTRLTGIDIDADNVGWCSANLAGGTFLAIRPDPPTSLAANSFDLIFGMSVMTHLTEASQTAWLSEIARLLRPGGYAALSTHGSATAARAKLTSEALDHLKFHGFLDAGLNPGLIGAIENPEIYRNSFHSTDFIERSWTEHFTIVTIVKSVLGNHHDLVLLRRK